MNRRRIARFAAVLSCAVMMSAAVTAEGAPGYAVRVSPNLGDFEFYSGPGNMTVTAYYSCQGKQKANLHVKAKTLKNGDAFGEHTELDLPCPATNRKERVLIGNQGKQRFRPDSTIRFTTELYQRVTPQKTVKKAQNDQEICPNAAKGDCPA
jgi:hypothetical protein